MQNSKFFRGAFILAVGTFIAKLLGAVYRIPLTAILGSEGLGIYQMVFPVYTVLLDFSSAGVPSALSKLVSENKDKTSGYKYLKSALKLFVIFGIVCTVLMCVFAFPFSKWQGHSNAYTVYLCLAPAVFFVSILSCYRGYFQGVLKMSPTAISQIVEQGVKLALGLILAKLFSDKIASVSGAVIAITVSEAVAVLIIYLTFKRYKTKNGLNASLERAEYVSCIKKIIKLTIPIALIGIIIPLSQVADSFLTLNIIGKYREDATSLYGLLSGAVSSVINVPVAICYGIAISTIPTVSGAKDSCDGYKKAQKSLTLTFLTSLLAGILCFIFSGVAVNTLFSRLQLTEKQTAIKLLKIMSPSVLFMSLMQTENAVLIGRGKLLPVIITMFIGVAVKTVLNILLLNNQSLNIYGGAIALIACYFFICLVNLILIIIFKVKDESKEFKRRQYQN